MQNELPSEFIEVLMTPGEHVHVRLDKSITCNPEIIEWCKDAICDAWSYDIYIIGFRIRTEHSYQLRFNFKQNKDALLFKLSWV